MPQDSNGPITSLAAPQEQHMLFLFLPLKKGAIPSMVSASGDVLGAAAPADANADAANGPDIRALTGVHFFMFYGLPAGTAPQPPLPVPSFQTAEGKDLFVVISIYDADFAPYISAFTTQPAIAMGLNGILAGLDESGIVSDDDPTSAFYILNNGGVAANTVAFYQLLMRYNFADPTIPAASVLPPNTPANPKYAFGATFPGLTVGSILQNYPNAGTLWPWPPQAIDFAPSTPPPSNS